MSNTITPTVFYRTVNVEGLEISDGQKHLGSIYRQAPLAREAHLGAKTVRSISDLAA
jgi:hypothetical protein